ncbi:hypothetical protein QQF64_006500, partial [Cirrhinus molitorella]
PNSTHTLGRRRPDLQNSIGTTSLRDAFANRQDVASTSAADRKCSPADVRTMQP